MRHEDRNLISQASEEPVDITVDLSDCDIGVAVLWSGKAPQINFGSS